MSTFEVRDARRRLENSRRVESGLRAEIKRMKKVLRGVQKELGRQMIKARKFKRLYEESGARNRELIAYEIRNMGYGAIAYEIARRVENAADR